MRKPIIEKDDKYNKLTAIKFSHKKGSDQYWLFKCDCGNKKVLCVCRVKRGDYKSCGCLKGNHKHGMTKTKTYKSWEAMKNRCSNPNSTGYKYWGGRGIKICDRWLKFENFYSDMGDRPEYKTIDRIDNDKGYNKSNCRWATWKEQANNKRKI